MDFAEVFDSGCENITQKEMEVCYLLSNKRRKLEDSLRLLFSWIKGNMGRSNLSITKNTQKVFDIIWHKVFRRILLHMNVNRATAINSCNERILIKHVP